MKEKKKRCVYVHFILWGLNLFPLVTKSLSDSFRLFLHLAWNPPLVIVHSQKAYKVPNISGQHPKLNLPQLQCAGNSFRVTFELVSFRFFCFFFVVLLLNSEIHLEIKSIEIHIQIHKLTVAIVCCIELPCVSHGWDIFFVVIFKGGEPKVG